MTTRNATSVSKIVGEICLYGTSNTGAGWLAVAKPHGQTAGDGDPVKGRSFSEAVWEAATAIGLILGHQRGSVWVYEPSGQLRAKYDLGRVRTFGDLAWEPAPQLTISAEAIIAASQEGGAS
jgi:hypothetical protein